jgi:tRNA1(Val) A37 N6-methylase TrmN6
MEVLERIGGLTLRQEDSLPLLGTDSLLLSRFATLRQGMRVLDLGCGVGVLEILLADREKTLTLDGVEIHPAAAALARRNLEENGLQGTILAGDLRDRQVFSQGHYDLIVSNPPYFTIHSGPAATRRRAEARSEGTCTLEELCAAAAPRLKTGGRFALVYRSERLTDLLCTLRAHALEPKRMQLVQARQDKPPKLVLLEAIRQGKPGLKVDATLIGPFSTQPEL